MQRSLCILAVAAILAMPTDALAQNARTIVLRADTLLVNAAAQIVEARGHVHISDGRVSAVAARAVYYVAQRRIALSGGVTVTSADRTMHSREATVFLTRQNTIERLAAQGSVTARAGSRALSADRMGYVPATDLLTAAGRVRLSSPTGTASGQTLSADLRRNTGTLMAARIRTREGTIEGERLDVNGGTRQAFLRGRVKGTFEDTTVTSETATVFEREKKVVFRGHVHITRPGRVLQADVVTFYYVEKRMIAEGQTRIIIQETP